MDLMSTILLNEDDDEEGVIPMDISEEEMPVTQHTSFPGFEISTYPKPPTHDELFNDERGYGVGIDPSEFVQTEEDTDVYVIKNHVPFNERKFVYARRNNNKEPFGGFSNPQLSTFGNETNGSLFSQLGSHIK